ncbi:excisionase family DNA-binding protein [Alkalihalobacillus sp. LMS39]|uniref:excisionase family DNA-binding protein n=1 Tax=Alkalihalobacillus sp. LMS39 TaxID=2924032 RepID=UPI001FB36073|nr:excisionase family DNA-binding protein [Alkalihalobacillus sp. LMS39]UOE93157.1 excisionase family DNA-binding protein [Alkalihalobacillus sp. LMS39]
MYITLEELAEHLNVSVTYIKEQVALGNIKAVYDGHTYLVNKEQFNWHKEQIEKKVAQWVEEQQEDIPEDIDVKDED